MQLDQEAVEEFKRLYLQEYGIQLTNRQAIDYGIRLIRLVRAVYGDNLPKSGFDKEIKKDDNNFVSK